MKILRPILLLMFCLAASAQDTTGILEGQISDASGGAVAQAEVVARNSQTGFAARQRWASDGSFRFGLPVGEYELRVEVAGFAVYKATAIRIDINRTVRFPVKLEVATGRSEVNITASGATVDL